MMVRLKRAVYILAFTFLGILLSTLIHGAIEYPAIKLIVDDGAIRWFSWETWKMIHAVGGVLLLCGGIIFGFRQGLHWWDRLYDAHGHVRQRR